MQGRSDNEISQYQKIAVDLASKIVDGKYKVGDKIYARSALASRYGVSSETARRAICVLNDLDIVESAKGSGVTIKSYEKAVQFTKQYQSTKTISSIKQDILASVSRQRKELEVFNRCLTELIDKTERFRSVNPFMPFQIQITSDNNFAGSNIMDLKFWQNTGATIIAIRRNDQLLISPGPYAELKIDDTLYYIGVDECQERVSQFLYPQKAIETQEDNN